MSHRNDWDWGRKMYETTQHSIDFIAGQMGVTVTEFISRSSRSGWTRNVQSAAMKHAIQLHMTEQEKFQAKVYAIEKVNTEMRAALLQEHRTDIKNARKISTDLFSVLSTMDTPVDMEELNNAASALKKLSDSMKTFILLERQAYGVTTVIEDPEDTSHEQEQKLTSEAKALDLLVNKFASVLTKEAARKSEKNIIDITPKS